MDLRLTGKTALVTGSTAGIGYATAVALAREGAAVVLNGRGAPRVAEAARRLAAEVPGAGITAAPGDVGTAEGAAAVTAAVPEVDVLVNNVSVFGPRPFADIPDSEWTRYFDTNVMSGVRLSRHYLAGMLARDDGRVVFVGSDAAVDMAVEMLHYSVTKTATLALARGLAELTKGTNVTVNTVLPGPTLTEGVGAMLDAGVAHTGLTREELQEQFFRHTRPTSLLQRFATPDEVANLIAYLASPLASVTNGAAVRAEGGVVRSVL
ncbi:SDR family oxidoreductase [Saccharothrix sp. 6-C]|uniref:SDR family NAD(P)-dependent oxidoreductase n=1 Tax=Saccharothrix sp. 6-C TaxID=2781735 RepID=UPI001917318E|nr:SDR family oxidoreductase [Saccharothrix sp. 6-C]QQQ74868.1 SDR family oxidoreductase [Saccharothrix sp. 6-C]